MPRFQYLLDPLFLASGCFYTFNRLISIPLLKEDHPFLANYLRDFLFIPCSIPVMLAIQRALGLRRNDARPDFFEIAFWTILFSGLLEGIFPLFFKLGVADFYDVIAYFSGACIAQFFWVYWYPVQSPDSF